MNALSLAAAVAVVVTCASAQPQVGRCSAIKVVDDVTGRGVPLVELETVNHIRFVTDSAGLAAFDEPGLMNQRVFFTVRSHGYEFPRDGFGYRGTAVEVRPGGEAVLRIRRISVAERLYRITGAGIYRDSVLVGAPVPIRQPLLNARVMGQDTVLAAVFRGKLYWFWGDTNRPAYPLGNFHTPGATSRLPGEGGLPPEVGVDLSYFTAPDGFAKETAHLPGEGPTWLGGLTVLRDASGAERMFATYAKVHQDMSAYRRGIVEWEEEKQQWREVANFGGQEPPALIQGPTFQLETGDTSTVYSATPYPLVRVPARPSQLLDPAQYEAFTCLHAGSSDPADLDRAADGTLRYGWKKHTRALGPKEQAELIKRGKMRPEEALLQLCDADSGKPVLAASGSVYWNAYRGRWVMIACELFGTSVLGEIWYAEADTPLGPWVYARKVVTHDRYSFYNPTQHPMLDQEGGRRIYFEGTYTVSFSGNEHPTPRYEYNQVMYRLDLADPRLALPVPVYTWGDARTPGVFGTLRNLPRRPGAQRAAFFARDRAVEGDVAAYRRPDGALETAPVAATVPGATAFYALPPDAPNPPATTVPLYEITSPAGERTYTVTPPLPGVAAKALCRVWRNPMLPSVLPAPGE